LRPQFLLLDEVTSAVDVEAAAIIRGELAYAARAGTGIVLVTHGVGLARACADHVAFLDHGRLVEAGDRRTLHTPTSARLQQFLEMVDAAD
jgi:polar amino acid transport system ATP-binding protein